MYYKFNIMLLKLVCHQAEIIHNILDYLVATTYRPFTLMATCKELYAAVLAHPWAQHAAKMRSVCDQINAINIAYGPNATIREYQNNICIYDYRLCKSEVTKHSDMDWFGARRPSATYHVVMICSSAYKINIKNNRVDMYVFYAVCPVLPKWLKNHKQFIDNSSNIPDDYASFDIVLYKD